MNRVLIVGTTGSGKTTVGKGLARRLDVPFVDLDGLFWKPNWTESEPDEFRMKVDTATAGARWVADGDYLPRLGDLLWERADTVVWLDPPLGVIVRRLVFRTISRSIRRTELWAGNREHLSTLWNKGEPLVVWARRLRTERRAEYVHRTQDPRWASITIITLRSIGDVRNWLSSI